MSAAKPSPVDEYLAGLPADRAAALQAVRETVLTVAPGADEVLSYNMPAFKFEGKVVGGFLSHAKHLSFYPFSGSTLDGFRDEVAEFGGTKSAIHFTPEKPLPPELVIRIVKARMAEPK